MKNLVVYTTRHGFTSRCVQLLQPLLEGETQVLCLNEQRTSVSLDWSGIDRVILGGSVYAGKTQQSLSQFAAINSQILKTKTLGLFVCSLSAKTTALNYLNSMFPKEIFEASKVQCAFGGGIQWNELKFYERWILGLMKIKQDVSNLDHGEISRMAEALRE